MVFKVPNSTSVFKTESEHDKYIITFAPELVDLILKDKKLTTYRFGKKYEYLKEGDEVSIQKRETEEIVATAKILKISTTTFLDLPITTVTHESYKDKEHQRAVFSGYYAYLGRPIEDTDKFLIFDFQLIK